jgi:short-subunit dehydrogenase
MNKLAWITGASTGIGAETAKQLAKQGWKVVVSARSEDKLIALEKEFPGKIYAYPCDITKPKQVNEIVARIEDEVGAIDLAFLNAGMFVPDTYQNFTVENFKKHYEVNVFGVAHGVAAVLERFKQRGKGHFAMTASVAGYQGLPRSLSYGSTKAALINFAESLWIECRDHNIKVQVVCPGFIETPMTSGNKFPMPMKMKVDKAVEKLIEGLNSDRFEITFPRTFSWILKTIHALPYELRLRFVHWGTQHAMKGKK